MRARRDEYVFRLPYHPPYDWESLLAFLVIRAIPRVEEVVVGAYRRSFSLEGRHGILEVRHDGSAAALEARIHFCQPLSLLPIVSRLRALFDLAADTSVIAQHFRRDLLLGRLVRKYPGLRVPGAWDGFELAVRAILGQQVSVAAASTLAGQIAQKFGERLSVTDSGGLTTVFPTAAAMADVSLAGMPRLGPARSVRSRRLSLRPHRILVFRHGGGNARELGAHRRRRRLDGAVHRHARAAPAGRLSRQRPGSARTAGQGRPLTAAALRKRAEQWRPWRAYAALYLWRAATDLARERAARVARAGDSRSGEGIAAG